MRYSLRIKRSALKELQKLDRTDRLRVAEAIEGLRETPHVGKPLKGGLTGLRRVRVGEYRVVYEIDDGEVHVLVVRVAHRREVYR